jgi:hypothetical protein
MTPAEVMNEIKKMPLAEKRRVLAELTEELGPVDQTDLDSKEETFVHRLRQKGLITEVPLRLPDDELRRNYKRIEVKGEPLSETIVQERI